MITKPNDITLPSVLESQVVGEWGPVLENYTGMEISSEKKTWMSKLAHFHHLNENSTFDSAGVTTLSNTPGIGNPSFGTTLGGQSNFVNGTSGSGDKWISPFSISLQVAAKTVGFDIVSTIPISAPNGMIYYVDYVYADGKLDGTGNDAPLLFQIATPSTFSATRGDYFVGNASANVGTGGTVTGNAARLQYVGRTRIEGYAIFKLLGLGAASGNSVTDGTTLKIADVFDGSAHLYQSSDGVVADTTVDGYAISASASYVRTFENQVYGFSNGEGGQDSVSYGGNWSDGTSLYEGALRGEGEADSFKQMGVQLRNKNIETKSFRVAISITQEHLQDMQRQHGFDLVKKAEQALVNETSQNFNKSILGRAFAMGWRNHINALAAEGVNLNMAADATYTSGTDTVSYVDNAGASQSMTIPAWQNYSSSTASFDNLETVQRRIMSKINAASDLIIQRGRRGPATFVVTNTQIASALKNVAGYSFAPMQNNLNQGGGNLYPAGQVAGISIYVDPNMRYDDTRVLVGRKGADDEPGLKFLPYLLAESISTISPETMAPKIALISRAALTEYGQLPETQYVTFHVKVPTGGIV